MHENEAGMISLNYRATAWACWMEWQKPLK